MPTGNLDWGDMGKKTEARYKKDKSRADALNVPKPVDNPSGKGSNAFNSIKAYTTRAARSVYSKK